MGALALNVRAGGARLGAREEGRVLEFVREPLAVPSVVRPDHERGVLYVRVAALRAPASRIVAVLPEAGVAVRAALREAFGASEPVERAVVVGADMLLVDDADGAPGVEHGIGALVDVVRAFTDAGVPFVWRTRSGIGDAGLPPLLLHALVAAGRLCTVELGIASLDDELARALEGGAGASAHDRIRLATSLTTRGVHVRALVDPLVPMLTDQQAPLEALLQALQGAGIHRIGARYVVLTRERARVIAERLGGMQRALLQGVFADEPWRTPDEYGPRELHKKIPPTLRMRGHERLVEIGTRLGIAVDVLDPVVPGEFPPLHELHGGAPSSEGSRRPRALRVRPQMDLFNKGR